MTSCSIHSPPPPFIHSFIPYLLTYLLHARTHTLLLTSRYLTRDRYAAHFDLLPHCKFSRTVTQMSQLPDGRWRVAYTPTPPSSTSQTHPEHHNASSSSNDITAHDTASGQTFTAECGDSTHSRHSSSTSTLHHQQRTRVRVFDYVIVATGLNSCPVWPEFPGMRDFPGRMVHSRDYRV